MGLKIGPWLRSFKDAVLRNETDAFPVAISWAAGVANNQATLPLGTLKQKIMHVTGGRKIVYVVDTAFTPANAEKIVNLASGADILFIEATFLDADRERATARHHLTARQAGTLARQARVKRLATFHHSPRYRDCRSLLVEEAEAAFHGTQVSAVAPAASECRAVTTGQCGDGALPEGDTSVVAGQSSGDENTDSGCSKPSGDQTPSASGSEWQRCWRSRPENVRRCERGPRHWQFQRALPATSGPTTWTSV